MSPNQRFPECGNSAMALNLTRVINGNIRQTAYRISSLESGRHGLDELNNTIDLRWDLSVCLVLIDRLPIDALRVVTRHPQIREDRSMSVYKVIELVGTSEVSWADAAKNAVETARKSLREIRVGEVTKLDLKIEDGKLVYRARLNLSFKYTGGE